MTLQTVFSKKEISYQPSESAFKSQNGSTIVK